MADTDLSALRAKADEVDEENMATAAKLMRQAADEIERLRKSRDHAVQALKYLAWSIDLPPEAHDARTWEVEKRNDRTRLAPVSGDPFPFKHGDHIHVYVVGKGR